MSNLNMEINEITEKLAETIGLAKLKNLSSGIMRRYRDKESTTSDYEVNTVDGAMAYMVYRLPATALVIDEVLNRLKEEEDDFTPISVLDLGSGPGSSVLPLMHLFPNLDRITLLEEQDSMKRAGEAFLKEAGVNLSTVHWINKDFKQFNSDVKYDIVLSSYMANELENSEIHLLSDSIDKHISSKGVAVIIVPGVPEFFQKLLVLRNSLIEKGFNIVAPCTFTGTCNM